MAALITLLRGQWLAYWRRYARAGRAGAASLVILTLLFGFAASRFAPLLRASARELESGGAARFTRALGWVFIAWLASLWEDARLGVKPRALLRLPLRTGSLAIFTLLSSLIPPTSWLAVALSLSVLYPPLAAHSPPAAILATLAFVVASAAASFALVNLTRAAPRRTRLRARGVCARGVPTASARDRKRLRVSSARGRRRPCAARRRRGCGTKPVARRSVRVRRSPRRLHARRVVVLRRAARGASVAAASRAPFRARRAAR